MKKRKRPTRKKPAAETIFVSIASYRDRELIPTLDNMISNARSPNNLKKCWWWKHND